MHDATITRLPDGLKVGGDVNGADNIEGFGGGIDIGGSLHLAGTPGLRHVDADISVGGDITVDLADRRHASDPSVPPHKPTFGPGTKVGGMVRFHGGGRSF